PFPKTNRRLQLSPVDFIPALSQRSPLWMSQGFPVHTSHAISASAGYSSPQCVGVSWHHFVAPVGQTTPLKGWQWGSTMQSALQPSPETVLPSSQASPRFWNPSPHWMRQLFGQLSSFLSLPSSQSSTPLQT